MPVTNTAPANQSIPVLASRARRRAAEIRAEGAVWDASAMSRWYHPIEGNQGDIVQPCVRPP